MQKLTPLMNQYNLIKNKYKNSILFFRLGDFYEMFDDDAKTASKVLRLTLTSRQDVPMCGIPHHSYKYYVARLIKEGFSVAICEQMEDPSKAKGLVKREVVRVITSGTVLEENLLEAKINNFLCAIYPYNSDFAVAFIDVSTGDFFYQIIIDDQHYRKLNMQLAKYTPSEIILPKSEQENTNFIKTIKKEKTVLTFIDDINFSPEIAKDTLLKFEITGAENDRRESLRDENTKIVCSAIISYIKKTQPDVLVNVRKIRKITDNDFLSVDELVIKN